MSEIKITVKRLPPCCLRCKYYMKGRMYGGGSCVATRPLQPLFDVTVSRFRAPFCPLEVATKRDDQLQDNPGGEFGEET